MRPGESARRAVIERILLTLDDAHDPVLGPKLARLERELRRELGPKSWLASAVGGRWLLRKIRREERAMLSGPSREPPTFYERNAACTDAPNAVLCRSVLPSERPLASRAQLQTQQLSAGAQSPKPPFNAQAAAHRS